MLVPRGLAPKCGHHTTGSATGNSTEGFMSPKKNSNFKTERAAGSNNGILKTLGLAIVALAIVGLVFTSVFSGNGRSPNKLVFGKYGDKEIVYRYDNAFGQAVEDELAKYRNNVNQDDQFFTFVRYMAWQQAFNSMVVNAAVAYHLDKSGYEVSSRAVDRQIVEYGPYRTAGEFDEEKYRSASASQKASVREQFKEQLTMNTWYRDVIESPYRSESQLDFLAEMRAEVKSYDYITIPFTEFPDESVLEYARENALLFSRMPVSRITVADEKKAEEILGTYEERRREMDAFSSLAVEHSEDSYAEDGGSMGVAAYYRLTELIGNENTEAVFSLTEGDTAGPFETDYGWMIFRADGDPVEADLAADIGDIRSYMLQNEVGIIEDEMIAMASSLRDKAVSSGSFTETVENEGYEVGDTGAFPINYGGDSMLGGSPENGGDPALSGTASSDDFWSKVVPLDRIGEISQPVVLAGAVGLFSLASTDTLEDIDYWESLVEYEVARSRQADFRSAILSDDSKLLENDFSETYDTVFQVQG